MNINLIQQRSFENALAKGFHTPDTVHTDPVRIGARLALIHSELSEALEELSRGRMELYYNEGGKPEGFGIELADTLIRVCDLAESLEIALPEPRLEWRPQTELASDDPENVADFISNIHSWVSSAHTYRTGHLANVAHCLDQVVQSLFYLCVYLDVDLREMVRIKHEYNLTRPHRHGGKAL